MKIDCTDIEIRLERLVAGTLEDKERTACENHLANCEDCALLVELATVPEPSRADLPGAIAESVLRRTSGAAGCEAAEALLCDLVDGAMPPAGRPLLDLHLAHCSRCSALAVALAALSHDLPLMVELAPGPGFTERVLAASLPLEVRLARWWRQGWPRWVRRPRFAAELAYALTLFFMIVFTVPGTPLEAMPKQALEFARTEPAEALEAWRGSTTARALETSLAEQRKAATTAGERAASLFEASDQRIRTFFSNLASLLENATEDSPSGQAEPTEESR